MATCPKCGDFLDDAHDCSSPWLAIGAPVGLALTVALVGLLVLTRLNHRPAYPFLVFIAAFAGLTFAFRRALVRPRHRQARPRREPVAAPLEAGPLQGSPSADSLQNAEAPVEATTGDGISRTPGTPSVLVVDDEAPVRALLTRWLEPLGYAVRQAGNASQAMAAMSDDPASIMLCDVKMPGHNGLWLAERVHAHWPRTAIIMATSSDDMETVITSRKIGAVGYVLKPFGRELLLQALRKADQSLGA